MNNLNTCRITGFNIDLQVVKRHFVIAFVSAILFSLFLNGIVGEMDESIAQLRRGQRI